MKRDPFFFFFLISLVIQKQEAPSILYCVEERYKARAISLPAGKWVAKDFDIRVFAEQPIWKKVHFF